MEREFFPIFPISPISLNFPISILKVTPLIPTWDHADKQMQADKKLKNQITATQLSLPKGGGAIQGIGETFQANEFTGTASLSIPIKTSSCRGFEPQLSIDYSSGSGNGSFGLGFNLSIPNISRKTSKGLPKYDRSDTFLLFNGDDLVTFPEESREAHRACAAPGWGLKSD